MIGFFVDCRFFGLVRIRLRGYSFLLLGLPFWLFWLFLYSCILPVYTGAVLLVNRFSLLIKKIIKKKLFNPANLLGEKSHFLKHNKNKTPISLVISLFKVQLTINPSQVGFNSRVNGFICSQHSI